VAKRSLSSRKRVRQNERRRLRNKARRTEIKTQVRKFVDALAAGKTDVAVAELKKAGILLDRAAGRGTVHRNTASRRKSRLARRLNASRKSGK